MAKTFFAIVPYAPIAAQVAKAGTGILDSIPIFGKKSGTASDAQKSAEEKAQAESEMFDEAVMQLKQRVAQVAQGLFAVGLESVVLNDEQLVELFYNFYNPETIEKKTIEATPAQKKK